MPNATTKHCPICRHLPVMLDKDDRGGTKVDCPNCGMHFLSATLTATLQATKHDSDWHARIAHAVFRLKTGERINSELMDKIAARATLPGAQECLDNLVMHLTRAGGPGGFVPEHLQHLQAAVGVGDEYAVRWVLDQARARGLIELEAHDQQADEFDVVMRLTIDGWHRRDQLLRQGQGSRHAFMAMDFKAKDIREFFELHLVKGVERTGFELRTTEHAQKTAGLIDARMRVELHTSRFVVCDLTHNNRGAYWEAGFAEGIGRPVFYLCRHDVLASQAPETRPHFDIAHQAIVKWDPNSPQVAVDELVAMIRATLPGEAKMED